MIDSDEYLSKYKDYITCIHTPDIYQEVSSTKIRQNYKEYLDKQKNIKNMLPKEISSFFFEEGKGESK